MQSVALVMKRRRSIVYAIAAVGLLALAALLAWPAVDEFFAVDACLDSGGSYDYEQRRCIRQRNGQQ